MFHVEHSLVSPIKLKKTKAKFHVEQNGKNDL